MQDLRTVDVGDGNRTRAVTTALREVILAGSDGHFLGSEADLLERFEISRPTFRQVARVLEQEELLVVRRGIGGGYYSRKPSIDHLGTMCSNYMRSHNLEMRHIYEVIEPLSRVMLLRAAACSDEILRGRLADVRSRLIAYLDSDAGAQAYLDLDLEAGSLTAEMSGNPMIAMQLAVLYHFARERMEREGRVLAREDADRFTRLRIRLVEAILAGEAEVAAAIGTTLIRAVEEGDD